MLNPDFLKIDDEKIPYDGIFKNKIRIEKLEIFLTCCINERNKGRSSLIKHIINVFNGNEYNDEEKAFFISVSIEKALTFAAMEKTDNKMIAVIIDRLDNQDDFDFEYPDQPETKR